MAVFAVAFKVVDGPRWGNRFNSLISAIKSEAAGPVWEELTSLYLLASNKNAADLHAAILRKAAINIDDTFVVIDLSSTEGDATHGVFNQQRYRSIMKQR